MTSTKPRIAFVIPSLSLGGAERSLVKLANGLTRTGFDAFGCSWSGRYAASGRIWCLAGRCSPISP